jgi:hypothetical protein
MVIFYLSLAEDRRSRRRSLSGRSIDSLGELEPFRPGVISPATFINL